MIYQILALPLTLLGAFILVKVMLPKKPPMDKSNRINHIRLIWFAINRPELFTEQFPWLKQDELDITRADHE